MRWRWCAAPACARIVVNTHAHAEQLRAHLARVAPEALVSHEPELLETGGGLQAALPLLGPGPVFTLNADMVWRGPNPLAALAAAWTRADGRAALPGAAGRRASATRARATSSSTPAGGSRRRGAAAAADFVYAGAQIIDPAALAASPTGRSRSTWSGTRCSPRGGSAASSHPGGWVDVGRPEGIALAEAELAR